MHFYFLAVVLGVFSVTSIQGMFSVSNFVDRVRRLPEEVMPDDRENWLDPSFRSFYLDLFSRVPGALSFWKKEDLSFELFTLRELCAAFDSFVPLTKIQAQKSGLFASLTVEQGDSVFVVGDLHGALHSLARMFFCWLRDGKIAEDFTLLDGHLSVVFLGDYLNRSPYGFWLLPLLINFANKNPGKVFLLRGHQESDGYWEQFLAAREYLELATRHQDDLDSLPYMTEVNNFFQQLPDGLLVTMHGSSERLLISHSKQPQSFTPDPASVALVNGEQRLMRSVTAKGLLFNQFYQGSAMWSLFSAPVAVYVMRGILHRDSYAEILFDETLAKSIICGVEYDRVALDSADYSRTIISSRPIRTEYSLAYGYELDSEKTRETLRKSRPLFVCSSVDLSGGLRGMGIGLKEGVEARFLQANATGELFDYLARPVFLDDGYEPLKMEANVKTFKKVFNADSLLVAMGSPTVTQILPLVQSGELVLFFPATGSPLFRKEDLSNMVHMRHSYAEEVYPILERLRRVYGARKFSFVYQDDSFGKPLTDAAVAYLHTKFPECQVQEIPILRGHRPQEEQVSLLREFNAEAIGLFVSTQLQLSGFADRLGIGFLLGKYLFAIDFSTDIFHEFAERWGVALLQSSSFQQPKGTLGSLMEAYRFAMLRYRYPLTITSVEGFTAASWYVAAFRESYPNISASFIKEKLEKLDSTQVLGYLMPFDAKIRSFVGPVWINDRGVLYQAQKDTQGYRFIQDLGTGVL